MTAVGFEPGSAAVPIPLVAAFVIAAIVVLALAIQSARRTEDPPLEGQRFRSGARVAKRGGHPSYCSKGLIVVVVGTDAVQLRPVLGPVLTLRYENLAPLERKKRGRLFFPLGTVLQDGEWSAFLYATEAEHRLLREAVSRYRDAHDTTAGRAAGGHPTS